MLRYYGVLGTDVNGNDTIAQISTDFEKLKKFGNSIYYTDKECPTLSLKDWKPYDTKVFETRRVFDIDGNYYYFDNLPPEFLKTKTIEVTKPDSVKLRKYSSGYITIIYKNGEKIDTVFDKCPF